MKKLIISLVLFAFFSCSSNKEMVINEFIKEINVPLNGKKTDSLKLIEYSSTFSPLFFKSYRRAEGISKIKGDVSITGDFCWSKNYRWFLNENDLLYFEEKAIKSKAISLKKVFFDDNRIMLVSNDNSKKTISNEINEKAINNGSYTYTISNPIFNKDMTIAIISLETIIPNTLGFQNNKIVIYKKENKHWIKICEVKSSSEQIAFSILIISNKLQ